MSASEKMSKICCSISSILKFYPFKFSVFACCLRFDKIQITIKSRLQSVVSLNWNSRTLTYLLKKSYKLKKEKKLCLKHKYERVWNFHWQKNRSENDSQCPVFYHYVLCKSAFPDCIYTFQMSYLVLGSHYWWRVIYTMIYPTQNCNTLL